MDRAPNAPTADELARLSQDIGAHRVMLGTTSAGYDLDRTVERVMKLPLLAREEKEGDPWDQRRTAARA